jgi:flagellar P-ring protein FlgI
MRQRAIISLGILLFSFQAGLAQQIRIKDITRIAGARENQLLGYGIVVGLEGTGDSRQTTFTTQSVANMLQRFNLQVPASAMRVKNVAAVMLSAQLPPFIRSGDKIDVTVSSLGDAASLQGGILLQAPLQGADGKTYAVAQGGVSIGGFSAEGAGAKVTKNHPTVGRIPNGALVEAEVPMTLTEEGVLSLSLNSPDFATADRIAKAINKFLGAPRAEMRDEAYVDIRLPENYSGKVAEFISDTGKLTVEPDSVAKVIINERTGTIVVGGNVKITPVAVAHQGLSVKITTDYAVSQPAPFSQGQTATIPMGNVQPEEKAAYLSEIGGSTIDDLVKTLNAIKVTPKDIVAILQAIKQSGALQAELVIL